MLLTRRAPGTALTLGALVLIVVVTGCSSGSSGSASTSPSSPTPASSTSSRAGLVAPIIVLPGQSTASATVGNTVVFNQPDPQHTKVSTDRPDVIELVQGRDDGSAQFNPGGTAVGAGVAVVTITAADGTISKVTLTVT